MVDTDEQDVSGDAYQQCQFFVVRKKRLCRMTVRPGRVYCGEHEPLPATDTEQTDMRVPCPNDPKHTCYISKLDKHLAKCNARKGEDPPYIEQNINAPEEVEEPCTRVPLKDVSEETLMRVIEKVNTLFDKHIKDKIVTFTPWEEQHSAVQGDMCEAGRAQSSRRHLRQAGRLLQLAEVEGLHRDHTCYVELGAGKGMLSYYMGVAWCGSSSSVLAVDRAALRHKRDNRLPRGAARLRADLRHLALARAPPVAAARAVVGLAKHLCGVATDYALRCLTAPGVVAKTRGVVLATCCHHRCERAAYVGTSHLQELGLSGAELDVMFGVVSWATCGSGRPRAPPAPAAGYTFRRITDDGTYDLNSPRDHAGGSLRSLLTPPFKAEVGRRAKALLDHGRAHFLRARGFRARLCYYVPATESPENLCIVASKDLADESPRDLADDCPRDVSDDCPRDLVDE